MTRPEEQARALIDQRLHAAGWVVQDLARLNPSAARGVAVREFPTDSGPADYVLLVDRVPVGVIEAKRDEEGHRLTKHEVQSERYANATLKWKQAGKPLRFLFEATGQITRFTDGLDPAPRSREVFHFFRPEQLAEWLAQPDTLRGRLAACMPALPTRAPSKARSPPTGARGTRPRRPAPNCWRTSFVSGGRAGRSGSWRSSTPRARRRREAGRPHIRHRFLLTMPPCRNCPRVGHGPAPSNFAASLPKARRHRKVATKVRQRQCPSCG